MTKRTQQGKRSRYNNKPIPLTAQRYIFPLSLFASLASRRVINLSLTRDTNAND